VTRYVSLAEYIWLAEQVTGVDADTTSSNTGHGITTSRADRASTSAANRWRLPSARFRTDTSGPLDGGDGGHSARSLVGGVVTGDSLPGPTPGECCWLICSGNSGMPTLGGAACSYTGRSLVGFHCSVRRWRG
jgi:hypothetical protein